MLVLSKNRLGRAGVVREVKPRNRFAGWRAAVISFGSALLLSLLLADQTYAYVLTGYKWPQSGPGAPVTITYSYQNLLDGALKQPDGASLPASLIRASVEEALGLWAGVAPLNFYEVADEGGTAGIGDPGQGGDPEYPSGQFGQIRLKHKYVNGPDIPGQPPQAKAYTYYPSGLGNYAGDIYFDDADPWQEQGTLPTPDVLGAAIHELGHALGLDHTTDATANMYPVFIRYNGPGTGAALQPDDIAGIQAIYGAGVGSVTPLPDPTCSPCLSAVIVVVALATSGDRRARRLSRP